MGERIRRFCVANELKSRRANQYPCRKVTQNRAQFDALKNGHD